MNCQAPGGTANIILEELLRVRSGRGLCDRRQEVRGGLRCRPGCRPGLRLVEDVVRDVLGIVRKDIAVVIAGQDNFFMAEKASSYVVYNMSCARIEVSSHPQGCFGRARLKLQIGMSRQGVLRTAPRSVNEDSSLVSDEIKLRRSARKP